MQYNRSSRHSQEARLKPLASGASRHLEHVRRTFDLEDRRGRSNRDSWRVFTSAASSSSERERVRAIRDLKGKDRRVQPARRSAPSLHGEHDVLCRPGSPARTSTGSPYPTAEVDASGLRERQDRCVSWAFHRFRRNCGPKRSVTWSSTARRIGRGPSTSAAWSRPTANLSGSTRWRQRGAAGDPQGCDICARGARASRPIARR